MNVFPKPYMVRLMAFICPKDEVQCEIVPARRVLPLKAAYSNSTKVTACDKQTAKQIVPRLTGSPRRIFYSSPRSSEV
jgi:hypothetical protein